MHNEKTTPIIILGMHRSGTSCLAGSLQNAGVCLGNISTANSFNKKGNRENKIIMDLSNKLLSHNSSSWSSPPTDLVWNDEHITDSLYIQKHFNHQCGSSTWGFKDPRVLITFDFWNYIFPHAKLVGTIRNPFDVAKSLNRRDKKFTIEQGLNLWLAYNSKLLFLLKNHSFPLISFDHQNETYANELQRIITKLNLSSSNTQKKFFDPSLRTPPSDNYTLPTDVSRCYDDLKSYLT